MGVTIRTERPCHVMGSHTPVDTHFPGLPQTLSPFELFKAGTGFY